MGNPIQQPNQSQVYYDTEQGQYYTMKPPERTSPYNTLYRMYGYQDPKYLQDPANRSYLGNPYQDINQDRFKTNAQVTPYAELTNLFPSLNASLMQNSSTSLLAPTDTQSSGAGRFLSPQTTNTQGK